MDTGEKNTDVSERERERERERGDKKRKRRYGKRETGREMGQRGGREMV